MFLKIASTRVEHVYGKLTTSLLGFLKLFSAGGTPHQGDFENFTGEKKNLNRK